MLKDAPKLVEIDREQYGTPAGDSARRALTLNAYTHTYGKGLDPEKMEDLWQDLNALLLNLDSNVKITEGTIKEMWKRLSAARIQK